MTTSYVGIAGAESNSVAMFAHQAKDLLIGFAYRTAAIVPSLPAGWIPISVINTTRCSILAYKIAASSSEVSGTWTNAEMLTIYGVRDDTNYIFPADSTKLSGSGTSVAYGSATNGDMLIRGNTNWVAAFAACQLNSSTLEIPPSGMTLRNNIVGASTRETAVFDSNGGVSSYAANSVTVNTAIAWQTFLIDIFDSGIPLVSGSGGGLILPRDMNGGYSA